MTNSIPASQLVNVIPSVLGAGGNELSLNAVMLTESTRVPIGSVQTFSTLADVGDFFGLSSIEYALASVYFSGYETATALPSALHFAQYNVAAVGAYLRSGSFDGVALSTLQGLSGVLTLDIDGRDVTTPNIDLSSATSFSNAAALIQAGLQTAGSIFTGTGTIDDGAGGAGNTLTISAVGGGALHIGDVVTGSVSPATITAFGTGTGGVGTYTVDGAPQDFNPGGTLRVTSNASASYDAQLARFLIQSGTTGVDSTIDYATGSLSTGLKFTSAAGATLSQGAAAATPAGVMTQIANVTQNWASFMTTFEPTLDTKMDFAEWVQTTNSRFMYVGWFSDTAPLNGDAPASFPGLVKAAEMDGVATIYEPADDNGNGRKGALICGITASIDYEQSNSRIDFAYKSQSGLVADITNATQANNLIANGANFYAAYATANDRFVNLQRGSMAGAWKFIDPYVNQIWLNASLQLAFMNLLTSVNSIPYNTEGYNLLRQAALDPIQAALNAGVIRSGVTLSNAQRAQINAAAGLNAADTLQTQGWFLRIWDASPSTRSDRESPPMTLWYTDGGSVQRIELASINVL